MSSAKGPCFKLFDVVKPSSNRVAAEYASFKSVYSLQWSATKLRNIGEGHTRSADNWLVNLMNTGGLVELVRSMKTLSTRPY